MTPLEVIGLGFLLVIGLVVYIIVQIVKGK